jgi:hypothetical protein
VAVEKLASEKSAKIKTYQEALQTIFFDDLDIFYPRISICFGKNSLPRNQQKLKRARKLYKRFSSTTRHFLSRDFDLFKKKGIFQQPRLFSTYLAGTAGWTISRTENRALQLIPSSQRFARNFDFIHFPPPRGTIWGPWACLTTRPRSDTGLPKSHIR